MTAAAKTGVEAIGVPGRDHCNLRRSRGAETQSVADALGRADALDRDDPARKGHHGAQRQRHAERRRHQPVEQQSRPHEVEPHALVAQQRGAVGGVAYRRRQPERDERPARLVEPQALVGEDRVFTVLGSRKVRVHPAHLEVRAARDRGHRAIELIVAEPEPVHAGVDLQVARQANASASRDLFEHPRGGGAGHRRRQPVIHDAVHLANAQGAEDEDWYRDAGLPEPNALLDVGAGEHRRTGGLERERSAFRTVAVGIRLDDADDPGRHAARPDIRRHRAVVVRERVEIDAGDGRPPDHATP